jgi:hypothetical protein
MPNRAEIGASAAEFIHQVEGANVVPGGWVCGEAWFGSIVTVVEVEKRRNVKSTWIINSNHSFYPMEALYVIMKG